MSRQQKRQGRRTRLTLSHMQISKPTFSVHVRRDSGDTADLHEETQHDVLLSTIERGLQTPVVSTTVILKRLALPN